LLPALFLKVDFVEAAATAKPAWIMGGEREGVAADAVGIEGV
jgi:tRNA G18 (ribose-2'-O)-methylase SpoU